ncbi:hypothetical protein Bbelb_039450 [Branchiostoma belcheri]|nr:hypothetical protein Bbelb_039450 [Branchiostoma belcheri]
MAANTPRKECEEISLDGIPSDRCANCAKTFEGTMGRHRRNIFGTDTGLSSAGYSIKQAVESLADVSISSSVSKQHAAFVCNDCFYSVKSFVAGSRKTREAKQKFQEAGSSGFLSRRFKRGRNISRESTPKKPRKKLFSPLSPHHTPHVQKTAPKEPSTIRGTLAHSRCIRTARLVVISAVTVA